MCTLAAFHVRLRSSTCRVNMCRCCIATQATLEPSEVVESFVAETAESEMRTQPNLPQPSLIVWNKLRGSAPARRTAAANPDLLKPVASLT
eukprot:4581657-Amphidinium_carterae.1